MLRSAEDQIQPDPAFLDELFTKLLAERRTRRRMDLGGSMSTRRLVGLGIAAGLILAVLVTIAIQPRSTGPGIQPTASAPSTAGPSGSASAAPSVNPLTADELAWCDLHHGGGDRHQVEDLALVLRLVAGATSRDAVDAQWAGRSIQELALDPGFNGACRAAFSMRSALPASPAATPGPLALALNEFDHAVTAARDPLGITDADQSRLFQFEDGIRAWLDAGNQASARDVMDQLVAYIATIHARLDTDGGRRLAAAVAALDALIQAP